MRQKLFQANKLDCTFGIQDLVVKLHGASHVHAVSCNSLTAHTEKKCAPYLELL